jgi:hypothetical protein
MNTLSLAHISDEPVFVRDCIVANNAFWLGDVCLSAGISAVFSGQISVKFDFGDL